MPLLIIDFRIHWRYISTCKSSTCTVELQELCRPCRTKWIWEILGDMNQLTLPRLGGWVWLKIERMTLLFKVLKLLDTSCVVIQLLMMIVNRIMLIYRINYDPWDKEIHYWNLHRTTPLYIIGLSILLHFVITFHIILRDIISRDVVKLKSRVRRLSWSVLNWFTYYSCFTTHFSCRISFTTWS